MRFLVSFQETSPPYGSRLDGSSQNIFIEVSHLCSVNTARGTDNSQSPLIMIKALESGKWLPCASLQSVGRTETENPLRAWADAAGSAQAEDPGSVQGAASAMSLGRGSQEGTDDWGLQQSHWRTLISKGDKLAQAGGDSGQGQAGFTEGKKATQSGSSGVSAGALLVEAQEVLSGSYDG